MVGRSWSISRIVCLGWFRSVPEPAEGQQRLTPNIGQ